VKIPPTTTTPASTSKLNEGPIYPPYESFGNVD